jgi:hypothetical protein
VADEMEELSRLTTKLQNATEHRSKAREQLAYYERQLLIRRAQAREAEDACMEAAQDLRRFMEQHYPANPVPEAKGANDPRAITLREDA